MNFVECHDEPIHIPGYIQSFGYLIGIDADSHSIAFFSENITDIFSIENSEILFGKKITDFPEIFKTILASDIFESLEDLTRRDNETYFDKILSERKNFIYQFSAVKNIFSLNLRLLSEIRINVLPISMIISIL